MEYQDPGPPKAMLKDFSAARSSKIERAVEGPLAEHPKVPHSHHVIIVLERGVSRKKPWLAFSWGLSDCLLETWVTGSWEISLEEHVEGDSQWRWDLSMSSERFVVFTSALYQAL